ncbi:MAG: hypothetical protein NZL96_03620 [Patescibacteria group bacterium]|nr:hypothetical protein [Patescibacteria group bacterium]
MRKLVLILLFLWWVVLISPKIVWADELEQVTKELEALKKDLRDKEKDHQRLSQKLEEIKRRVINLEVQIEKKEFETKKSEQALFFQRKLLDQRAASVYKKINQQDDFLIEVFFNEDFYYSLTNFFYQKRVVNQDKEMIVKIVLYIKNLQEIKKKLMQERNQLAKIKREINDQTMFLTHQISQTKIRIAQLTAKQQELIAKKFASIYIPRSASISYSCQPDYDHRIGSIREAGFTPKFGFFTFGVPNRVGMNQWGAYGRAKAGQNEEEILRSYYNFDSLETIDTNLKIKVDGYGDYLLEDYLKRIYEVPNSWAIDGFSALKAQAIAARSYVVAFTENGQRSICPTEYCQVFRPEPKGGPWEQAVNETAGKVMKKDDRVIKAWYSSTHGGYIFSSAEIGWNSTSWTKNARDTVREITSFADLFLFAFDRESPIFYCNWGQRAQYNNTAWLKSEEVADIVNVLLLAKTEPSVSRYLYQVDAGGEVWNEEKVKEELRKRGISPFTNINQVSVKADFNLGRTTAISLSGDGGLVTFDGKEFRDWFNARAPANIQIRGPLYNVEIK